MQRLTQAWLLVSLILIVQTCLAASGQEILTRKPGETSSRFAQRLLPHGTTPAYPIQEAMVGPFRRALVLLFGETPENYDEGWVLTPIPSARGKYRKYLLPSTDQINLSAVADPAFRVKSAFCTPLHPGAAPSLLILYSVTGRGAVQDGGGRSYGQEYVTGIYRWNGKAFALDPLGDRLAGLSSEKAVQGRLFALTARRFRRR